MCNLFSFVHLLKRKKQKLLSAKSSNNAQEQESSTRADDTSHATISKQNLLDNEETSNR
jgi:hypothetical protein